MEIVFLRPRHFRFCFRRNPNARRKKYLILRSQKLRDGLYFRNSMFCLSSSRKITLMLPSQKILLNYFHEIDFDQHFLTFFRHIVPNQIFIYTIFINTFRFSSKTHSAAMRFTIVKLLFSARSPPM